LKSILVTGGCGFIGTSLIEALIESNSSYLIRILDNLSTNNKCKIDEFSYDKIEFFEGDIRDIRTVEKCIDGMDYVVHLAANTGVIPSIENPRLDLDCNVIGTFNLLETARENGVEKFIFASSGAPAGNNVPPIHEEMPPHPVSPYGASKLSGEGYCSAYFHTFGLNTVCLRFSNVYGPRSKHKSSIIAKFIRQAINNQTSVIYGNGLQTRDFLYIGDLINAVLLSLMKDVGGEVFQIATGIETDLLEVTKLIAEELTSYNIEMKVEFGTKYPGDVSRNYALNNKAGELLGWVPKVDLKTGIQQTVKYFVESK
jgi:UDP-glucose 4-epimerase